MKAFLKDVSSGIKYVLSGLPVALVVGGTGTFIWLACHGVNYYNSAIEEAKESPVIQEIIDNDTAILKEQLENKEITMQEYQDKRSYWESEENLRKYLESDKEGNKYYLDNINNGRKMATAGICLSIFYPFVSAFCLDFYFSNNFKKIIESAKRDRQEAKEIKSEEQRNRKYDDEYKEEIE